MNKLIMLITIFAIAVCGSVSGQGKKGKAVSITGAGATFPLPFYNMAFKEYKENFGPSVVYGGIGSGGGIRSLKDKVVDFAGSDAYLSDKEMNEMPYATIHIPTCMGAVTLAYNLKGVKALNLTGEIIADIYMGKITKWNDSRIAKINQGVSLPNQTINPVYRSDGSGTTFIFSDYLSKVSAAWKESVGTGKALKWPAGIAAKGNPGVAGTISQTDGAIGYVGSEYAFSLNIPVAKIQNRAGYFMAPTNESISAAASSELPADTRVMITDSPSAESYPISCFTWILLYKEQSYAKRTKEDAENLLNLLNWMIGDDAQALTTKVHYAPLPAGAKEKAAAQLRSVTYNGVRVSK